MPASGGSVLRIAGNGSALLLVQIRFSRIVQVLEGVLQNGPGRQLAACLIQQFEFQLQPLMGVGDLQQSLLLIGHRAAEV